MHIEFDCGPNRVHPSLFGGEHQRFFQLIVGILNAKKSKLQNHDSELTIPIYLLFLTTRKAAAGMKSILHLQHDFTNQKLLRVEL